MKKHLLILCTAMMSVLPINASNATEEQTDDHDYTIWELIGSYEGREVQVAIEEGHIYVRGIFEDFPESVVTGVINGDKVVFESDQYLGTLPSTRNDYYFVGAKGTVSEGSPFPWWVRMDAITFDYDPATQRLEGREDEAVLANVDDGWSDDILYRDGTLFFHPILHPSEPSPVAAAPLAPVFVGMMGYDTYYHFGQVYYYLPAIDVNYNILDTDRLYYNVIVDGDVYTLQTDDYPGLDKEYTDIPWAYVDENRDVSPGASVYRYFTFKFEGFESLDLQSFYACEDGTMLHSDRIRINSDGTTETLEPLMIDHSSVATLKAATGVELYDLDGRRTVGAHGRGAFNIMVTRYADGQRRAAKVMTR